MEFCIFLRLAVFRIGLRNDCWMFEVDQKGQMEKAQWLGLIYSQFYFVILIIILLLFIFRRNRNYNDLADVNIARIIYRNQLKCDKRIIIIRL